MASGGPAEMASSQNRSPPLQHRTSVFNVPASYSGPEYFVNQPTMSARKYVVFMAGLPARGKTFIAQKLCRLLGWLGHMSRVYNVQEMWKEKIATDEKQEGDEVPLRVADFDFIHNPQRKNLYIKALEESAHAVREFFESGGILAFINDDFTSAEIRKKAEELFEPLADSMFYIEVLRDPDTNEHFEQLKIEEAREYNREKISLEDARRDFAERISLLQSNYEPIARDKNYIKLKNRETLEIHGVTGYIPSRLISYLLNLSQSKIAHPIYLCRHGESVYNLQNRVGGNSALTANGKDDAQRLKIFLAALQRQELEEGHPNELRIWTSQLLRAIQTAQPAADELHIKCLSWSCLNEIHAGVCEHLTHEEVTQRYPLISEFRKRDKYNFRYPEGESYQDLVARLEPVIMELENTNRTVVVVGHQAILRALLAYFSSSSAESFVNADLPPHKIWRCTYNSSGIPHIEEMELPPLPQG